MIEFGEKAEAVFSEMRPDLVWYVLRNVSDYAEQLRLSTVCKEWSLICKSLPKLTITIRHFRPKEQAGQALEKAMQGRSNLRELDMYYLPMSDQDLFDAVQHVSSTIEKLSLHKLTYLAWTRLQQEFPKLLDLTIGHLVESPGSLILPNLKRLVITVYNVRGSVVEEIIRSCPSLEDFDTTYNGPVHVKSNSLVHLGLKGASETVIEACNLKSLRILKTSPSLVLRGGNIEYLDVFFCEDGLCIPPRLHHQLKVLRFESRPTLPKLPILSNLKHLVIRFHGCQQSTETVTLQQFVPQGLEVLCFDSRHGITADEMFQKEMETKTEILALLHAPADDLPCFPSLKSVVVSLHEHRPAKLAFPVLVQLLKCSPRLEQLVLRLDRLHMIIPPGVSDFLQLDTRVRLIRTYQKELNSTLLHPENVYRFGV